MEVTKNAITDHGRNNVKEKTNKTQAIATTFQVPLHRRTGRCPDYSNENVNCSKEDASSNAKNTKDNLSLKYWIGIGLKDSRTACLNFLNFGIGAALVDRLEDFVIGVASSHPRDILAVLQLLALTALDGYESASSMAIRTDSATAARLRKLRSTAPASVGKGRSYSGESSESNPFDDIDEEDDEADAVLHCDPSMSFLSVFSLAMATVMGVPHSIFHTALPWRALIKGSQKPSFSSGR